MNSNPATEPATSRILDVAFAHHNEFRADFYGWLFSNLPIYKEFERQAVAVAATRRHYGARTVMEVFRHNSILVDASGGWKINNNRTPDCARLFALLNPAHAEFFSFRDGTERRAA